MNKTKGTLCNGIPADCLFNMVSFRAGEVIQNNDPNTHYLIFCYTGHIRVSSTLFHDEILCAGEIMFLPRQSDCSGVALSDTVLLVHQFNNTVCDKANCILAYLYAHRYIETKKYCCKLPACPSFIALMENIITYITHDADASTLWQMKHREMIWIFINYYTPEELSAFFQPMCAEQVPFKSLVLTHYRKAEYTDCLAEMCGYGVHTFRRIFKKEFGVSPYKWLTMKRAEQIELRLSHHYISFADIIEEFNFSSQQQFSRFCVLNLGDSPSNLRARHVETAQNDEVAQ